MTQDKKEKLGVKTNTSAGKSKTADQRAKKKFSATLLCILDSEDELSGRQLDLVPVPVREWLAETFTMKTEGCKMKPEEKAKARVITQVAEGSAPAIRQFRTSTSSTGIAFPAEVIAAFKDVDRWSFDVFALNQVSQGHSLKYIMCEVFNKYDLLSQFKIPLTTLIAFAEALEAGYGKYQNPYHNAIHAADVTQTVHSILLHTGTMHWLTDLEILAIFFSTSVHDYEHTGTTNEFHIQTRSEAALLYNDTSVLENHHLSAAYQLVQKPGLNILINLTKVEWREMRYLVIKMVLGTDMSSHFQDMKNTLRDLRQNESLDKGIVMSMIVHVADISHPAKHWELHHRWAEALMEEFFKQGALEAELGLPISPLCDREATNIAESQIGFMDVIVKPVFALLFEVVQKIIVPFLQKASSREPCHKSTGASEAPKAQTGKGFVREREPCTETDILSSLDIPEFKSNVMQNIQANRNKWNETLEPKKGASPEKESDRTKDHVSEDRPHKDKPLKRAKSNTTLSKSKRYCTVPQSNATCDCQLCDSRAFEPMDISFIAYNMNSSQMCLPRQDSDATQVTESYEELVDNESSWRKAAGQTVESNIQEMRGFVPKTKPLAPNESDDIIIEEFIPDDPPPQPGLPSGPPAISGQQCPQSLPNVGFIMTDLTQNDMEIFSLWNEEVLRRASEQQKQGQSRMPADAPLQVAVQAKEPMDCQACEGAWAGKPPGTFVLQVISFDSPSVTYSKDGVLNCDPGPQAVPSASTNDSMVPANAHQQNQTDPCGAAAAAVSVTSLSYGVFKIPQYYIQGVSKMDKVLKAASPGGGGDGPGSRGGSVDAKEIKKLRPNCEKFQQAIRTANFQR